MFSRTSFCVCLFACLVWTGISPLGAVILLSTGDPAVNTTPPGGKLANSGWQFTGAFGSFAATAIDAHYFITVKHAGMPSGVFTFRGVDYPIVQSFDAPAPGDLRIFQISGTLPAWAPLYPRTDEVGRSCVVIGRGSRRGDPIYIGSALHGWGWGAFDGVQRWGPNVVTRIEGSNLYAAFDRAGKASEAHTSTGDSGGGVFINDNGTWKLAGVTYGVDPAVSATPGGPLFDAALFDRRGFYESNGHLFSGSNPVPSGFYAVRISAQMSWIRSIVPASAGISSGHAEMIAPTPGSTLPSSVVTFDWTPGSAHVYKVFVGTSPGATNIYNSGKLKVHTLGVNSIPTNGSTIYVRLWSKIGKQWGFVDYTYRAYG